MHASTFVKPGTLVALVVVAVPVVWPRCGKTNGKNTAHHIKYCAVHTYTGTIRTHKKSRRNVSGMHAQLAQLMNIMSRSRQRHWCEAVGRSLRYRLYFSTVRCGANQGRTAWPACAHSRQSNHDPSKRRRHIHDKPC